MTDLAKLLEPHYVNRLDPTYLHYPDYTLMNICLTVRPGPEAIAAKTPRKARKALYRQAEEIIKTVENDGWSYSGRSPMIELAGVPVACNVEMVVYRLAARGYIASPPDCSSNAPR